jgi:TetR/AcrR family transcriptional regulator
LDRRDEIYEKATELFVAHGYDRTSMSLIAKALNINKSGLYHYFDSKEDLLFFIHERNMKRDLYPIIEAAEKIKDPEKRLSYVIGEYAKASMARDAMHRVLVHEFDKLKPEHRRIIEESWRKFFDIIRNSISELAEMDKSWEGINETFAAFALIGMCRWTFNWFDTDRKGAADQLIDNYRKVATDELIDTYRKIFFKGIIKPSESRKCGK